MSFVSAEASKKKKGIKSRDWYNLFSTTSIAVILTPIELLRLLYFLPAAERVAGFYIRFKGHARLLGKKRTSRKKSEKWSPLYKLVDSVTTRLLIKCSVWASQNERYIKKLQSSHDQILTVHCHCWCSFCSFTIKIERNAAEDDNSCSFTNWSYNHSIVVCTIDILITFVESIFCRLVGLCAAGDTERFIHNNDVVSQISCHNGVYWVAVYNEFKRKTPFWLS